MATSSSFPNCMIFEKCKQNLSKNPKNECSFKFSFLKKAKLVRGAYEPQEDTDLKLIIILTV